MAARRFVEACCLLLIAGNWGQGIYFATEAAYCDSGRYFFPVQTGQFKGCRQLFLATVLTGQAALCEPDTTRRMPPIKPKSFASSSVSIEDRCDSVACDATMPHASGKTTRNYVIFDNGRAYPSYLIT